MIIIIIIIGTENKLPCSVQHRQVRGLPVCRLCGEKSEAISHLFGECKCLAQKQYKRRHDNVPRLAGPLTVSMA